MRPQDRPGRTGPLAAAIERATATRDAVRARKAAKAAGKLVPLPAAAPVVEEDPGSPTLDRWWVDRD